MECAAEQSKKRVGFGFFVVNDGGTESEHRGSSTSSSTSCSDTSSGEAKDKACPSSPTPLGWSTHKAQLSKRRSISDVSEVEHKSLLDDFKLKKLGSKVSEMDMMKERFAKLLLGEDMSGCGKGVCTALALSNAITNLCATVFGQLWRLEPLPSEKKSMWQREMEWLLCVSDRIIELIPSWQTFSDGSQLEVMACRPRLDLLINLPALCKLDNMLLEMLDSFNSTEFWYVDQGKTAPEATGSTSFHKAIQRQEDKWWLPVPRVPPCGLSDDTRMQLNHKRESASQILKAAMAINNITLSEMEVPESYLESLPKNGRTSLGDVIYRYVTSEQFSSECLLDCLDLSSEHIAVEIANRIEASIYIWRRRVHYKPIANPNRSSAKSSWEMVKDLMVDGDKRTLLAERAESLLFCLKQRFPGLTQTALDTSKIQFNRDVGKAILESYSRALESTAFNIVARIDDLMYVDDLTRHSDRLPLVPTATVIPQKKLPFLYSVPLSGILHKTTFAKRNLSPAPLASPARGERTPFLRGNNSKPPRRGLGVKRVLTNYLGGEAKAKNSGNLLEGMPASRMNKKVTEHHKES